MQFDGIVVYAATGTTCIRSDMRRVAGSFGIIIFIFAYF